MKKLLLALLFLNFATLAHAQSTFTAKDASGVTQTFKSFNCTANICSLSVPADITGAAFGVTANPFFVTNSGTFAVQATQAGTWNIGTISTLPAITGTVTANQGGTWNIGTITTLPAITGTVTANAGTNLNTSALALESGGNLAGLVAQIGAVTASPTANTVNDRLKTLNTTLGSPFQAGGSIGNTAFGISGTLPAFAATPTFNLGTISTAATAANQTNASQKTQIVDGSGNVIASTANALNVAITSGGGSGGTSSTFAAAFPSVGTAVGMSQGGNMVAMTGTSGNLNVQCANCSGSGVSTADQATFTAGTSLFAGTGGFYQTTATSNALTNGQQGMWQMTANRAGFVNLRNASGAELGVAAAPLQVSLANTAANSTAVKVDGSAVTQPVSGTVTSNVGTGTRAVSIASGQVASGAYASGAFASGSIASGAIAAGAQVDLLTMRGTKNAGTAAANSLLAGGVYNATPLTLADTQQSSLQTDANGFLKVNVAAPVVGLAQGSTTSGQTGSLIMGAVTTSAPTYTTAQTSPLSLDTSGNVRTVCSNCSGSGATGTDQGSFTAGTSVFAPSGGFFQTTATSNPLTNGQWGVQQLTATRAAFTNLRNNAGTEVGTSTTELFVGGRGTAGSATGGVLTVQGVASMTPILANPGTAANWGIATQGSTTSGQSGVLNQAAVLTAAPTYTTAQTSPINMTTGGAVRMDNTSVAGTTILTGNGTTAAGSQRVTIASDSAARAVGGEGATGSTAPTGAVLSGVQSGANMVAMIQASASVPIDISTATTTQIVALSGSTKIYVTSFDFMAGAATTFKFVYGTGTNCGTGTTNLTAAYDLVAQAGVSKGNGVGPVLVVPSGNALCITNSAAQHVAGSVSYTQF